MTFLITAVLLALTFTYFAINNPTGVNITLGNYFWSNVPIYIVALGSLLFGLVLSWIISSINALFTSIKLFKTNRQIKDTENEVSLLKDKIQKLEVENSELRLQANTQPVVTESKIDHPNDYPEHHDTITHTHQPRSLFDRLRQSLTT